MFNDKSTHNERQEALQTVMRKGDADVGEQVHSPAQLNKLLARSTEEFNIFQQVCHSLPLLTLFCWDSIAPGSNRLHHLSFTATATPFLLLGGALSLGASDYTICGV